jgi:peroxidase
MNSVKIILILICVIHAALSGGGGLKSTQNSRSIESLYRNKRQTTTCPFGGIISCNSSSKYRTFDGSCNNLVNPYYGKADTPYERLLTASYDDGTNSARTTGLPNPRTISLRLNNDNSATTAIWNHIWTTFGQFLTHDITETASTTNANGSKPSCSSCTQTQSPDCLSITLLANDPMGITCMPFIRSSASFSLDCASSQRQQLNLITPFIDASNVYGSSVEHSNSLRSFSNGKMLTSAGIDNTKPYPPKSANVCSAITSDTTLKCFESGDSRTSENLGLSGIHALFIREHNRIAQQLALINSAWNDETLFQETRRIVAAIMQHIVFNQYLPATIGFDNSVAFGLTPTTNGTYFSGYNSSVS